MPKNENGNVTCITHKQQNMILFPKMGVLHQQKKPDSVDTENENGGNFNFNVFICPLCQYTELYARPYNPEDPNNITPINLETGW